MTGDHNDRDQRLLLMNQPHRFQAIHSRHEDIEKQQIEVSGFEYRQPFAAVAGADNAVACPFEQKSYSRLDGAVVVHDQNFRHGRPSANTWSQCVVVKLLPVSRKHFLEKNRDDVVKTMSRKCSMCPVEGRRCWTYACSDDSPLRGVQGTCTIEAQRPISRLTP